MIKNIFARFYRRKVWVFRGTQTFLKTSCFHWYSAPILHTGILRLSNFRLRNLVITSIILSVVFSNKSNMINESVITHEKRSN